VHIIRHHPQISHICSSIVISCNNPSIEHYFSSQKAIEKSTSKQFQYVKIRQPIFIQVQEKFIPIMKVFPTFKK
jgi:hypothetical protein